MPEQKNQQTGAANIRVSGEGLTVDTLVQVARNHAPVAMTDEPSVLDRIRLCNEYLLRVAEGGERVYGVNTGVGGMSGVAIATRDIQDLQRNLLRLHKCGVGERLSEDCVRSAMLVRLNSLAHGVSGTSVAILERLVNFLNAGITPCVPNLGSIGASGDLVPLSYVAGSIIGSDPEFLVSDGGEVMPAPAALRRHGWTSLNLLPKEGLAMINGSSFSAGIAALQVHDIEKLIGVTFGVHALALQAVGGSTQSFHDFIHRHKPHPGQILSSRLMVDLLQGSRLTRSELASLDAPNPPTVVQDRYALRCIPQYLGPLVDTVGEARRWIETEINSASDNPLIDADEHKCHHGGNFLGQYVGMALDRLRNVLGMAGKHVDVQTGWLMHPDFSNGLPASLVGNQERSVNMGMKGVQLTSNSIAPLLSFYGQPLADRFVTHAEQFNQNLNSQSFGAALLTHRSIELYRFLLATALVTCIQAVDLRVSLRTGSADARPLLSPATAALYEAVHRVTGRECDQHRPYVFNDDERPLDTELEAIADNLASDGAILDAVSACTSILGAGTAR